MEQSLYGKGLAFAAEASAPANTYAFTWNPLPIPYKIRLCSQLSAKTEMLGAALPLVLKSERSPWRQNWNEIFIKASYVYSSIPIKSNKTISGWFTQREREFRCILYMQSTLADEKLSYCLWCVGSCTIKGLSSVRGFTFSLFAFRSLGHLSDYTISRTFSCNLIRLRFLLLSSVNFKWQSTNLIRSYVIKYPLIDCAWKKNAHLKIWLKNVSAVSLSVRQTAEIQPANLIREVSTFKCSLLRESSLYFQSTSVFHSTLFSIFHKNIFFNKQFVCLLFLLFCFL